MKKLKRFKNLFSTVVFLMIALVMLLAATYVLRPLDRDFFRTKLTGFYAEEDESLDIVGLGSSALYRYVNAPLLWEQQGYTSFMLATASQPVALTENLIDEAEKTQSPQLYIIETRRYLDQNEVEENRIRIITDNMKYSWNRVAAINKMVKGWENRLPYYLDLIQYHGNWENYTEDSLEYLTNEKKDAMKGWRAISRVTPLEYLDVSQVTAEKPILESYEKELRSLLEKCKKENLNVLFVATPWQATEEEQQMENYVKRIIEEAGFPYLDGNQHVKEIGLDYGTDFYNDKHTNVVGAEKFTTWLGDYIAEHYDISSEHPKKIVQSWEQASEEQTAADEKAKGKLAARLEALANPQTQPETAQGSSAGTVEAGAQITESEIETESETDIK